MKKPSKQRKLILSAVVVSAATLSACGSNPQRVAPGDSQAMVASDVYYTVERGDQLAKISESITGDSGNWQQIAEANGISDPRKMRVGQQLLIPGYLLPTDTTDTVITQVPTAVAVQSVDAAPSVVGSYFPKVIYQAPQLNAKLLMRVAPGTTFPLEKLDNGWYRVSTDQGVGFLRVEDGEPVNTEG